MGQFNPGSGADKGEFKGRGRGEGGCEAGTCSGAFTIMARAAGGAKIVFDLNIIIDATAAGAILWGTASFKFEVKG